MQKIQQQCKLSHISSYENVISVYVLANRSALIQCETKCQPKKDELFDETQGKKHQLFESATLPRTLKYDVHSSVDYLMHIH